MSFEATGLQSRLSQHELESLVNNPDFESIFGANSTETLSHDSSAILGGTSTSEGNCFTSMPEQSLYEESSTYTLPEFVRYFTASSLSPSSHSHIVSSRDSLRMMLSTFEKPQLIELLSQSMAESAIVADKVRLSVSKLTVFRRLLVRNISFQSTSEDVKSLLSSRYGPIEEGTVVYDRISGRSKGFAFMTFVSVESACDAILDSMSGLLELHGRQILLKFAADRQLGETNSSESTAMTNGGLLISPSAATCTPASFVSRNAVSAAHLQPTPSTLSSSCGNSVSSVPNHHQHASRKLFVYNLSPNTTSESLGAVFGQYGPIEECFVVADHHGVSKRYAFVTFYTEDSTWRCLEEPTKLVDGQMTFTHLASEGPSSSQKANHRNGSSRTSKKQVHSSSVDELSPLAELLNELMLTRSTQ